MKIALIGYGKMGKAIEAIALERGHEIVLTIDAHNTDALTADNVKKADVAIEFTGPHTALENLTKLIRFGVPVVSGSTGWLEKMPKLLSEISQHNGTFLYASNFSIGVNLFFELNKKLAALMHPHKDYTVSLEEIHHTEKKDAPSGTAITLAEQIMEVYTEKKKWVNDVQPAAEELLITSKRIDPAPGIHTITYSSEIDDITITHTAHNRKGFALGAVLAAEFIRDKKGVFSMKDVLDL
ncbi:4-hydroxy-tetrahydrodipicolinate reductase [Niabella ginsenosidivorans]|uniref:4-hydroxy-tetrahydrodipicolinate reductase n=1 Tax=Niabella ginsenosidivorans TaxID=1176587 RepID=A0A1A9I6U8_9BACT|nr:4-hydroxy-tetrahydrodipicolinate reductase [Niabella ginsenosidivorans]ANH82430.1 4-hydroxy-tetrahydrodipicolinate reductase [Niabella ginsenosidivorans]